MNEFLQNVVQRIRSKLEGRNATSFDLAWDDRNVTVHWLTPENKTESEAFKWESVLAVDAFKRDFFSVDCICLAFRTHEGWIEINEDMRGWKEFLTAVEKKLCGFPKSEEWWVSVAFPAFATNHSNLWRKQK